MQVPSLGLKDSLKEGMETHSSILTWRILETQEPGGLWSIGSLRVRHNLSNLACSQEWVNFFKWIISFGVHTF